MEQPSIRKRPGPGTALLLLLAGGVLGVILGCLGYSLWASNLFHPFRPLPALPEPAARLAGASVNTVTAEGDSGQLYAFDLQSMENGWAAVSEALSESDEPCEPFAESAPPVNNVLDRRIACQNLADAGATSVFVLRDDGRVWYWTRFDSAYMALAVMIFVPLCGGLLGLAVGLVAFFLLRRRAG